MASMSGATVMPGVRSAIRGTGRVRCWVKTCIGVPSSKGCLPQSIS